MARAFAEDLRLGQSAFQIWRQFDLVSRRVHVRFRPGRTRRHLPGECGAVHRRHRRPDPVRFSAARRENLRPRSPIQASPISTRSSSRACSWPMPPPSCSTSCSPARKTICPAHCWWSMPSAPSFGSSRRMATGDRLAPAAACRRRAGGHDQDHNRPRAAPAAGRRLCGDRARPVRAWSNWCASPILLCLFVVGIAWMAAGLISSGCIAFPVASSCIAALPWTPPIADIHQFAALGHRLGPFAQRAFPGGCDRLGLAQGLAEHDAGPSRLHPRSELELRDRGGHRNRASLLPTATSSRPSGTIAARARPLGMIGYAILTGCLGNLFWFLAAPDPRFGIGFLLALPALVVAAGTPSAVGRRPRRSASLSAVACWSYSSSFAPACS